MYLHKSHRPAWAEINLDAIRGNIRAIQKRCGADCRLMGVVKADGYGHGAVAVARECQKAGIEHLAVSSLDEVIELREAGINQNILILGPVESSEISKLLEYSVSPTVENLEYAREISELYRFRSLHAKVHLKVESGMGRLGVSVSSALETLEAMSALPGIVVEGMFTHMPSAGMDPEYCGMQIQSFRALVENVKKAGLKVRYFHMANSSAVFAHPETTRDPFNLARPGLALYGYAEEPVAEACAADGLVNAMTLKARAVSVKKMTKGQTVGYGRTYTVQADEEWIALFPLGYADGISTCYSNLAKVSIGGIPYPVAGRVCMDYTMVSLGKNPQGLQAGAEGIFFGQGGTSVEEFGKLCGRIPYEVTCDISKRVPRVYSSSEER